MTQSALETEGSQFEYEGTDFAQHDVGMGNYHPIPKHEALFWNGLDALDHRARSFVATVRHLRSLIAYRAEVHKLAPSLLQPITPDDEIDFGLYGIAAAIGHIKRGKLEQVIPDVCCGPSADDWQDDVLRQGYKKFLLAYRNYAKTHAPKRLELKKFHLLLPPKLSRIVQAA